MTHFRPLFDPFLDRLEIMEKGHYFQIGPKNLWINEIAKIQRNPEIA